MYDARMTNEFAYPWRFSPDMGTLRLGPVIVLLTVTKSACCRIEHASLSVMARIKADRSRHSTAEL